VVLFHQASRLVSHENNGRPFRSVTLAAVTERTWPEAVERVVAFLRETGAEVRVEEFAEVTPTAADAARAVGCDLSQIVKSLVFDCDGKPVLVMAPGDRRVDRRKVAAAAGAANARIAGSEAVEAVTGFSPGAVAPFPLPKIDRILLDPTLLPHRVVWVGAGSPNHLAALAPGELSRLSRARTVDVLEEAA
jgi:prolyl-tRNA editing enzyme YbaK/EbsC (Cys-tRNA(Pro) deacylase)